MATIVTKTIGDVGRDYQTIAAWLAAAPASLVADDVVWKGVIYAEGAGTDGEWLNDWPSTAVGKTTDSTRYFWLAAATGAAFHDHVGKATNALKYDPSKGVAIRRSTTSQRAINGTGIHLRLSGLQVSGPSSGSGAIYGDRLLNIERCIAVSADTSTISLGSANDADLRLVNSIVVCTSAIGVNLNPASSAPSSQIRNCTIVGLSSPALSTGVRSTTWAPALLLNTVILGFNAATELSFVAGSGYNATDKATLPGSNNVTNLVVADQIVGSTGATLDVRPKAGNSLQAGTRDAANTADLDILGVARSTTTPTIGAVEYAVSGSPAISLSPDPASVTVGGTTQITGVRTAAAPAGAGVSYNALSSDPAVATVPTPITMTEGLTELTFAVTGVSAGSATITLTNAADSGETDSITVTVVTVRKLKLLAHIDALGATAVKGAVFAAPTGGALVGAKIGEFSGAAFKAVAESGQAPLEVAVADFGGSALTTADMPVCVWEGTSAAGSALPGSPAPFGSNGVHECTVIEV